MTMQLSSILASKVISVIFFIFMISLGSAKAKALIRAGYWDSNSDLAVSEINSTLFTHLLCGFARLDSTSYQLSLSPSDEEKYATFTNTVKRRNPLVITLLSIGDEIANNKVISSMVGNRSHRKSFVYSSIERARLYGFQGIDFSWIYPKTTSDFSNMGILFDEWRATIISEATNSNQSQLILTTRVKYSPGELPIMYPVDSLQRSLDWIHVMTPAYYLPGRIGFTGPHAPLFHPTNTANTDHGIHKWINEGLSPHKLVLSLNFHGYAWTLSNPEDNGIGAPATGPAITSTGTMSYKDVTNFIERYGANVRNNSTYVMKYCTAGTSWISFDDDEIVRVKVAYAKGRRLLGYFVWQLSDDDNWVLSEAAAEEDNKNRHSKLRLIISISTTTAAVILLLGFIIYICRIRKPILKGTMNSAKKSMKNVNKVGDIGELHRNFPNPIEYTLADIEAATNKFSIENKLGEGGYGPVYRAKLQDGQEIAVKKLSKTSTQGFVEFKNEVVLTAKLQHVNLVRVLGFCIDGEEQMLIYEYMPEGSLDCYLFDPIRGFSLDWEKRVHIIEGISQGLLYLQEYSRLTIIHRDLKASNVLLDENMKPKISDFGMARIFVEDEFEANTERIVGTLGYIPPEYARRGIYSTKSDVYSFGVLLLQIVSGKRISLLYGENENLSLLEYAYELWKDSQGMEFMDPSLDDTYSSCKLMRCLQTALLCVQEDPNDRPSILEVSSMLKNETTDIMTPKKPAFSKQTEEEDKQRKSTARPEICSNNEVTVSEVAAR